MPKETLNEREFELINIIGSRIGSSQRELSRQLDLSLGFTNMLIRRLITKGFIRIKQLNKRKVEYMLTPKGFSEKMRKSVKYTLKTMQSIGLVRQRLKDILSPMFEKGERDFVILGDSDLALLTRMMLIDIGGDRPLAITLIKNIPPEKLPGTLLICTEKYLNGQDGNGKSINLLTELAHNPIFFNALAESAKG